LENRVDEEIIAYSLWKVSLDSLPSGWHLSATVEDPDEDRQLAELPGP
jgi:uncharacterized protein YbdZ (MbtH family)